MRVQVLSRLAVVVVGLVSVNCTSDPAFWSAVGAGLATSPKPQVASEPPFPASPQLFVYGGLDHDVFLGCLNCSKDDYNSVLNPQGTYGSKNSSTSILSRNSVYGSQLSGLSPCNTATGTPPILRDQQGSVYGYLTINPALQQVQSAAIRAWLAGVCSTQ
jgi:hypothetical protein